jgi:hypothetical protein
MRIFFPDVNIVMFLILVGILALVVYLFFKKDSCKTFHRNLIPKSVCEKIIEVSQKYKFLETPEEVDDLPMQEIPLFGKSKPINHELWNLVKEYYLPLTSKHGLHLNYAFLRRYNTGVRNDLIMHFDNSIDAATTVNILLSDEKDFEGGDLYIFNKNDTEKILNQHGGDMNIRQRETFINDCSNIPVLNLRQGDAVHYKGSELLHGVTTVTKGERYVLGFFSSVNS